MYNSIFLTQHPIYLFHNPDFAVAATEDFRLVHTFCEGGRGLVGSGSLCPECELKALASDRHVVPEASDFCIVDILM